MKIEILVPSSSSDETYIVAASKDDEDLLISCTCQAGAFGKLCKHKRLVLSMAVSEAARSNDPALGYLFRLIEATSIPQLLSNVALADQQYESAKKNLELAKRELEKATCKTRRRDLDTS
jgi:hypothetical protein